VKKTIPIKRLGLELTAITLMPFKFGLEMPTTFSPLRLSQVAFIKASQIHVLVYIDGEADKIQKDGWATHGSRVSGFENISHQEGKKKWAVFLSLSNLPHQ
jgi:hypothetical protein